MMGTSLHTLVQMVDNGLGLTFIPAMAIEAGILEGTGVDALPLKSDHGFRRIALIWRRSSPRESEFRLLAESLREIVGEVIPGQAANGRAARREFEWRVSLRRDRRAISRLPQRRIPRKGSRIIRR